MGNNDRSRAKLPIKLHRKFLHTRWKHVKENDIGLMNIGTERVTKFQVHTTPPQCTPEKTEKPHCRDNFVTQSRNTRKHPLRHAENPTITRSKIEYNLISLEVRKLYHRLRNVPRSGDIWHTENGVMAHRENKRNEENNTKE